MNLIELILARLQGKGWGSGTMKKEFASASSLLNKFPHLCVDIGGNKGLYTKEILSKFPMCKVVIFEPSKNNSNLLHIYEPFMMLLSSSIGSFFCNKIKI